jgi:hypothetical protein
MVRGETRFNGSRKGQKRKHADSKLSLDPGLAVSPQLEDAESIKAKVGVSAPLVESGTCSGLYEGRHKTLIRLLLTLSEGKQQSTYCSSHRD